jgi:hypothetical protein
VKRAGIFLMIVALAVGIAGCEPGFIAQYTLNVKSALGGTVTTPGEGLFRFPAGSAVNLVAEAERGYEFVGWTSNSHTIADANNATTTITLNKNFYFVIANFKD